MAKPELRLDLGTEMKTKQKIAAIKVWASKLINDDYMQLTQRVEEELEKNMALERKPQDDAEDGDTPYDSTDTAGGPEAENSESGANGEETYDGESSYDSGYQDDDDGDDFYGGIFKQGKVQSEAKDNSETLLEDLERQIALYPFSDKQRLIAKHIVGNLDNSGFFGTDPYELADFVTFKEGLPTEEDEVLQVLEVVQSFEPVGIAARNLQESLLMQLKQRHTPYTPLATRMIDECYDDLMELRVDRIVEKLGITLQDVKDVLKNEIRKLDPKPGGGINSTSGDDHSVVPTFIIDIDGNDIRYEIPNNIPELYISKSYEDSLDEYKNKKELTKQEEEVRKTILKDINNADIFIKALKMRQETLSLTIEAIIKHQADYFTSNGDVFKLKPMKLEDLEALSGRDKSTLSRATAEKYVRTPWGLMALRDFFSEGINKKAPDGTVTKVSTMEVKAVLQDIVDNEDKQHPLSDETLCSRLNEQGYDIARRTVVKYRDQLNIPNAKMRNNINNIS